MSIKMSGHIYIALLLSFLYQMIVSAAETGLTEVFESNFDVEPGGEEKTFVGHGDGLKCEFTYACQGGTLEEWAMYIMKDDNGDYTCLVERPENHSHSYLFFTQFRLKVKGGSIKKVDVFGSDPHKPTTEDEYKIHKHYVEHTDNFKHALHRITAVVSRKKHPEL